MRMAIDQAGHNAAAGQIDHFILVLVVFSRQIALLAYPGNHLALDNNRAIGNRIVQRSVNDAPLQHISFFLHVSLPHPNQPKFRVKKSFASARNVEVRSTATECEQLSRRTRSALFRRSATFIEMCAGNPRSCLPCSNKTGWVTRFNVSSAKLAARMYCV